MKKNQKCNLNAQNEFYYYYYFSLYVDEISVNRNVITTLVKFDKYSLNMKTE